MQKYTEISSSTTLKDSRQQLLDNDKTAMSNNSGTSFPTNSLEVGMTCFRSDELKLYYYDGRNWKLALDLSGDNAKVATAGMAENAAKAQSASNAGRVNGHTVDSDVPENAQFTDTQYIAGEGIDITQNVISVKGVESLTFDQIYPIGSIYMSVNSTNPKDLFGVGTWAKIESRFLLGSGDNYTLGSTGGEATHTLTVNEMPSHNHGGSTASGGSHSHSVPNTLVSAGYREGRYISTSSSENYSHKIGTLPTSTTSVGAVGITAQGDGQAHNNLPPYFVVNIWRRTA